MAAVEAEDRPVGSWMCTGAGVEEDTRTGGGCRDAVDARERGAVVDASIKYIEGMVRWLVPNSIGYVELCIVAIPSTAKKNGQRQ